MLVTDKSITAPKIREQIAPRASKIRSSAHATPHLVKRNTHKAYVTHFIIMPTSKKQKAPTEVSAFLVCMGLNLVFWGMCVGLEVLLIHLFSQKVLTFAKRSILFSIFIISFG